MMTRFTPFLLFDGDCADALTFYQSVLGGDLALTRVADTPMKQQFPPQLHDHVVNATLDAGPIQLTASDWLHPKRQPERGNMACLYLSDAPYADLSRWFDGLSEGADPELLDPLTAMPFGSYGHLADRFGVHWFFRGEAPPS